jgi:MFS transporter, DHA1 family, multidrug resistance protein
MRRRASGATCAAAAHASSATEMKPDRRFPGWLVLLGALTALGPLSIDMYLPAFLAIAQDLQVARGAVERTLPMFLLGLAIGQLVYGPLSDRFGRRAPMLAGLSIYLFGSIGCALAADVQQLAASRLVQALGGGAGMVIARAVIRDRLDARGSARALSTLMLVMGAAPILAPLLGSWMLAFANWRGIFAFQSVYALACIGAVWIGMRESRDPAHVRPLQLGGVLRTYAGLLSDARLLLPVLAGACGMGGMFAYIAGSPFVFMGVHGLSQQQYGLLFGLNAFGLVAASQLNAWCLRRRCPLEMLRLTFWIPAAAAGALLVASLQPQGAPLPVLVASLFVYVASLGVISPNTGAMAMAEQGRNAGAASALLGSLAFAVGTGAGIAVSLVDGPSSLPLALVMSVCGGTSALFGLSLLRRRPQAVEPAEAVVEPPA